MKTPLMLLREWQTKFHELAGFMNGHILPDGSLFMKLDCPVSLKNEINRIQRETKELIKSADDSLIPVLSPDKLYQNRKGVTGYFVGNHVFDGATGFFEPLDEDGDLSGVYELVEISSLVEVK